MQLPHRLTIVTPVAVVDEYGNPSPTLHYGPGADRREIWANVQPARSRGDPAPGRDPITASWSLFTYSPIAARERVEWRGLVLLIEGSPATWAVRFGRIHYQATLTHVEG
ncbi:hypothetical protein ALI144C_09735 [Actinosynnema sp. ALI-1.44]|uniref:phage head completion protein n=1 Tax=Actinosynnema sp. ALI-1.44 TaxID=1933779 RepID=UPI00097C78E4|nr:hypothetical protein [Actinosynnema sp. ALI-1.44]ONI86926.1 hypothetical protein ALI144C_09735 [Actinosynnema sp. ALI-1.44]